MDTILVFFFFTSILFFIYFITIAFFGYLMIIIFNQDYLNKKLTLKRLLKAFAIGLSIHLVYGTIIISIRIFNFFTMYLPFIICDIGLLIYIFYKKSNSIKKYFRMLNKTIIILFIKKNISIFCGFFIVFFMLYILQMHFINKYLAYSGNDAYLWFNNIRFVQKYGFLDYNVVKGYTPGFVIFCSSMIIPINNYTFFYYFFKYIPFFFSIINILVLFVLSKDIFKKKIYIYFTLVMYLGFTYMFNRNMTPLPSLLATTLGFLFLLFLRKGSSNDIDLKIPSVKIFLKSNIKDKKIFYKGLLFTGISLASPFYGLVFIIFYFFYEFYLFFIRYYTQPKNSNLRLLTLRNFFLSQILIFLIFAILMSPFIILTSINLKESVFESYFFYFSGSERILRLSLKISSLGEVLRDLGEWFLVKSIYYYINEFFRFIFGETHVMSFYKETIEIGMFLIIIGLFINFKKKNNLNEKQNYLINFFKFTFILTFLIFILCQLFILFFDVPIISNFSVFFYEKYRFRLYEIFSGYWAVIFVLSFSYMMMMMKKKILKLKEIQIPPEKLAQISKISLISLIIVSSGFFYILNFGKIYHSVNFNEDQIQSVSFIGDYFEQNPLEDNNKILLEEFEFNSIYGLIVDKNLEKEYYNFTLNSNYTEFNNEFNLLNCEYAFLNISRLDEYFKANFTINFNNINKWSSGYIFAKIK